MTTGNARQRLESALNTADPHAAVRDLAKALRSEGMGQLTMYRLYEEFIVRTPNDDPRYDALADTMDLIWSGPWAKGWGLFETELTNKDIEAGTPPRQGEGSA